MEYRIGLDIGIGSVGWSVISGEFGNAKIENFGTRLFDSGENSKDRKSLCQERRGVRSVRRLERRRGHRKVLLKNHLDYIGVLQSDFFDEYAKIKNTDVYRLKADGLSRRLSPAELYKCLVHTCNHRGYREFYEDTEDDVNGKNKNAVSAFDRLFAESGKRTVSEYLLDSYMDGEFVKYRNREGNPELHYLLIRRSLLEDEVKQILDFQKQFYPQLTEQNIDRTVGIIFAQRDFEDGPGDKNDETRRYQGFLATRGACPFYKENKRGFRSSVIADVYAVANTLSQYRFVNERTGELLLPKEVATELIRFVLESGKIAIKDVQSQLKKHEIKMIKSEFSDGETISKAIRFLTPIKQCIESAGEIWEEWIQEDQFDIEHPSKLHQIAEILSTYQTPHRRKEELKKLSFVSDILSGYLCKRKLTGTASCSYRYMCEAIKAFCNGEVYGNFQAHFLANKSELAVGVISKSDKLAPFVIDDKEVRENRVVLKAINETRKILNAIIEVYGTPTDIVVEVADELGRSFSERGEIAKRQKENEKQTLAVKNEIIRIMGYDASTTPDEIKSDMVDRYKLYIQQEGKCLYSGKPLGDIRDVLSNALKIYEIDHIVPYSLILDNTLSNKALVFAEENQEKKQRTPLMYLSGERRDAYLERIHCFFSRDNDAKGRKKAEANPFPITPKKLAYLKVADLYSPETRELLDSWKSRNINDTRYITKYIVGIIEKNLKFTSDEGKHVWGVKGAVTSRFRRIWLEGSKWGEEQKDRSSNLNHALDATVIACLTPPYIEIASDGIKLRNLYYKYRKSTASEEYRDYLAKCKAKMEKYYGFSQDYTGSLLRYPDRIPSFVKDLRGEVEIRFNDSDEEKFREDVRAFYPNLDSFVIPPHIPITSRKQNMKYQGQVADSNPIRVERIGDDFKKIKRIPITKLTKDKLDKLYTTDESLKSTLCRIFDGKDDGYSVESFLKENGLRVFVTDAGQKVYKVSVVEGTVSNIARIEKGDGNHATLGGLGYYCFELYRNAKGDTCFHGVKMIDIVKKNKKLFIKEETIPSDYVSHIMYLFKGDYVTITDRKGRQKFSGFIGAAYNVNQNVLCYALNNTPYLAKKAISISRNDTVHKYAISILGEKGGEIKRSVPLSLF